MASSPSGRDSGPPLFGGGPAQPPDEDDVLPLRHPRDYLGAPRSTVEMSSNPASLVAFADGIWICAAPVRFLGLRLTSTMTVLRLSDGGLLLTSPVAMTPERRLAVEALGRVAHLYAPNLFHHR